MRNSRWLAVLSPVGFLLIWELASRSGVLDPRFFPPPSVILQTLAAMTRSGELPYHVVVSGRRIVLGFLLGAVPAVAVGLAWGLSHPVRSLLMPLVSAIYPIPKIAIYPLIIFYLGLGEASKVSIVALSIFFLVLLNAMAGVIGLERAYFNIARAYGARPRGAGLAGTPRSALAAVKHAPDATDQAAGPAPGPQRLLGVWWRAVRPFSFTASVTPVLVGSAVAYHDSLFDLVRFGVTLVASVAIHAATNLINDYYDHLRGVDTAESIGPSGVIQQGLLAPRAVLLGGLTLFALGGLLGLWLVAVVGWPILAIGAASVLAGYAYTGGPLPLGYIGLGDLTVFLFLAVVTVLGAYYVQAGTGWAGAGCASLPVAALVAAILVVNNLRDIEDDRAKGKRTLATFIGERATRLEVLFLLALAYLSVLAGVALRVLPPYTLIVFLTLRQAAAIWGGVRPASA